MSDERKSQKETPVAARFGSREMENLERVMDLLEPLTGERNVSAALRYIVANFDIDASPLGKEASLIRVLA